jgi:large subunit ribosomal protein L21
MYAIVEISGKQYKVEKGDQLQVARLSDEVGSKVLFDKVLLTDDGKAIKVGKPAIKGAKVEAEIIDNIRGKKVRIYKKKRRKGYQRKKGHRQDYSIIEVKAIKASEPKKKPATKTSSASTTKKK